jgi:mannose-6-phosphate isomerase-like protein (cupin superfamily)
MNRRDLIHCSGLFALAGLLPAEAASKIPNAVVGGRAARVTHEPFGDLAIYFEGPTDQLKSVTAGSLKLKPGMEPHPPHEHPEEEFMVVTEGTGEILVDGKKTAVGPASMMYCAGGKLHGIKNTGTVPLLFYFYKWTA